jgi:hypothetical protein
MASGRPVLIIPYTGNFPTIGRRVMVAWKRGREAARAVKEALPILAKAESVALVAVNPEPAGSDGLDSAGRMAQHLSRHGVKAAVDRPMMKGVDDATVLLNAASDMAADLIVSGGYGHSRIRELPWEASPGRYPRKWSHRYSCPTRVEFRTKAIDSLSA